jgi:hypothetical protein
MGVPLRSTRGCLGIIYLNQSEPRRFDEADFRLAEAIGSMVGQAVDNARLDESEAATRRALEAEREHLAALAAALNRTVAEADLLRGIALAVAGERSLTGILTATVDVLDGAGGALMLLHGDRLEIEAATGQAGRDAGQRVPRSERSVWQVIERGEPPLASTGRAAVPLRWHGQTFGLFELVVRPGKALDVPEVNLLRKAADEIAGWVHLAAQPG